MDQRAVLPKKGKHDSDLPGKEKYAMIFLLAVVLSIIVLAFSGYFLAKKDSIAFSVSSTSSFSVFDCGTSTISDMDNNSYKTVKIGDQCWMKENFKAVKDSEGTAITRFCYNDDIKNCDTDGGLYDWNTAMYNSATEGAQGICPDGWHIPRDSEWFILENYLKDPDRTCDPNRVGAQDCDGSGTKLKSGGISGFDGFLSGYFHRSGMYYGKDAYTFFWSSTANESGIFGRFLSKDYSTLYRSFDDKTEKFSIRCLKN